MWCSVQLQYTPVSPHPLMSNPVITFPCVGVHSVQVALLSEIATVEFDEYLTTSDALTTDIASLGFDAECIAVSSNTEVSRVNFKVTLQYYHSLRRPLKTSLGYAYFAEYDVCYIRYAERCSRTRACAEV